MPRPKKRKPVFKVDVVLHNNIHKALNEGSMTIQQVVNMGISRSWAYQIKKSPAELVEPWQGKRHTQFKTKILQFVETIIKTDQVQSLKQLQEIVTSQFQITRGRAFINRLLRDQEYYEKIKPKSRHNPLLIQFIQKQFDCQINW
ncbi:Hypothetical_protein [Hexamita inflata]|uniref:Hypothetical_protein n=1 Tax=Hexamita inflata TaxID=28002 RepID=A0AA86RQB0_9EUKA|nr:Hypothetical protein HINF_LOCUS66598 [Hexamita inflata]